MSRYPKRVAEFADCSEDSGSEDNIGPEGFAGGEKTIKRMSGFEPYTVFQLAQTSRHGNCESWGRKGVSN